MLFLGAQFGSFRRNISTTVALYRSKTAARPKYTRYKTNPVTWEQLHPAHYIFVRKGFLSYNTSNLKDEERSGETAIEDLFIRKFMEGTWINILCSPIVIKRRANMIFISAFFNANSPCNQYYFLQGYTETLLSYVFKCPVKLDIQTVEDPKVLVVTHV